MFTAFAMVLAFAWLNNEFLGWIFLDWILRAGGVVIGVVSIYFHIYSLNEKEKLDGDFIGFLVFRIEGIRAGELDILVQDIEKIEFHVYDYDGCKNSNYRSIEPKVSNGTNNQVRLKMKDSLELKFNFQLKYGNEFEKKMWDLLIFYHLADKISFLALIQYIGISDSYERIQEFKKELTSMREGIV